MKKLQLEVVGLSYRLTTATVDDLSDAVPLKCELVREPDNEADTNAIKVVVMEKPFEKFHIGYIRRASATEIAPRMDKGKFPKHEAWLIAVDEEANKATLLVKFKPKSKSAISSQK
jgi:hypothetical protein